MNNQSSLTSLIVVVAIGLIFGSLLRLQPVSSSNDKSRWSTVWSLNAGHGYVIDETPYPTIDKVKREGHFYSSKPALPPTLIAGLVWAIGLVTGMTLPDNQGFIVRFVLVLINLIPFAWLLVLYSRLLQRLGFETSTVLYCLCAAGLGTYLTAYSVTLNNHTLAATATFFALYCFIRIAYEGQRDWKYFGICGLCAAWAVANEMLAFPLGPHPDGMAVSDRPQSHGRLVSAACRPGGGCLSVDALPVDRRAASLLLVLRYAALPV